MNWKALFSWPFTAAVLTLFVVVEGRNFLPPATYWFKVNYIHVEDGFEEKSVFLEVDREIVNPFTAHWDVTVRRIAEDGNSTEIVCTASGAGNYNPSSRLPDPLTLDWWTNGDCPDISIPGRYQLTTLWTLTPPSGLFGTREVLIESNIFRIE